MNTDARLKQASDALKAQIDLTEEKRQAYRATLKLRGDSKEWWLALSVAAVAYAAAADRLEELHEEHDDAFSDWQYERLMAEVTA